MNYLVFSDSHGDCLSMEIAVDKYKPQGIIFLGDCTRDIDAVRGRHPGLKYFIVNGNNDFYTSYPNEDIIDISGTRILLTHGHTRGVKNGVSAITDYCIEKKCGAVFFGHTHIPLCDYNEGILLLNPGSAGYPYRGEKTFAVITENKDGNGIKTSIQTVASCLL